jgi:bifunctional UDP-N-acetylglucosamine pyrophosphorylase/glucosamine-1-phosphate N-acetyltransferase
VIEDGAFVGSDSMLIAPVRIGARAVTGAGSVVTRDVAPDATVLGVPAREVRRPEAIDPSSAEPRDGG